MIRTRHITSTDDLQLFAERYVAAGGFPLDVDYLRRSLVYACFAGGRMVGGFVVHESDDFRSLQDMPRAEADRIRRESADRRPYEIMCLWMERELRGSPAGTVIWLRALSECLRRPGRRLLLCTVHDGLFALYNKAQPEILYRGEISLPDGTVLPKYVLAVDRWSPVGRVVATEVVDRSLRAVRRPSRILATA